MSVNMTVFPIVELFIRFPCHFQLSLQPWRLGHSFPWSGRLCTVYNGLSCHRLAICADWLSLLYQYLTTDHLIAPNGYVCTSVRSMWPFQTSQDLIHTTRIFQRLNTFYSLAVFGNMIMNTFTIQFGALWPCYGIRYSRNPHLDIGKGIVTKWKIQN